MELRWQPSFDVSALHAAWAVSCGRKLRDEGLQAELAPVVSQLEQTAASWSLPESHFWRQMLALSADHPSNQELAERLFRRLVSSSLSPATVSLFAGTIANCKAIMRRRFGQMMEELAVRAGPLTLAWEARGPGLLYQLASLTESDFLVESATVLLVQPVVGGDGGAHLNTNRVHIEAVLTDVESALPETLRLAWLLGQLNLDRPLYGERMHGHSLAELAELALLPAVLTAADYVQLATYSSETVRLALTHWLRTPTELLEPLEQVLTAWWETAKESEWPWQTSLVGLSKMVEPTFFPNQADGA